MTNLTELEALLARATPGPMAWQKFGQEYCLTGQHGMRPVVLSVRPINFSKAKLMLRDAKHDLLVDFTPDHPDAQLILAAYNALPGLIKELREARASEDRLAKVLEWYAEAATTTAIEYDLGDKARAALEAWKARKV